jgi:O-antigen ligase
MSSVERVAQSTRSEPLPPAATPARIKVLPTPGPAVRIGFAIFVASIPFETVLGLETLSLSRIIGSVFFLIALTQPEVCFRRPPAAFWWFEAYYAVFLVNAYFRGSLVNVGALTLGQLLILFWIASNLLRYPKVFLGTLHMFVASCFTLSVLQLAGKTTRVEGVDRISALGEDPNSLGAVLSLGLLTVLCISYGRRETKGILARLAAWFCGGVIVLAVVRTGSRGAAVALACGVGVLMLTKGSAWMRLRNVVVAGIALISLVALVATNEVSRRRWEVSVERRSMAGREFIYPAAVRMFLQKPVLGWGAGNHIVELGARTGNPTRDTHNLYLWVLTEDGVIGAIPYFAGLWLCWRAAWRARRTSHGLVPLALLSTTLIMNMDLTWQCRKIQWMVLGLAMASGRPLQIARKRLAAGVSPALGAITRRRTAKLPWAALERHEP